MEQAVGKDTKMEEAKARAPLASQEAMEESPIQMCGEVSESVRGKEFKVDNRYNLGAMHYVRIVTLYV